MGFTYIGVYLRGHYLVLVQGSSVVMMVGSPLEGQCGDEHVLDESWRRH